MGEETGMSIDRRLLLAARHTYDIAPDGSLPVNANSDAVGYLGPVPAFVSGDHKIDAVTVGQTDSEIIVAFRGTLPPLSPDRLQVILDWASDFDAKFVSGAPGFPGRVHQGFLDALDDLWPDLKTAVDGLVQQNPAKPIYVTGHSKGGAVANLAAMRLALTLAAPPAVVTFAAPRAGDQTFADAYAARLPRSDRYEYADDLVPHVPPSDAFLDLLQDAPDVTRQVPELEPWLQKMSIGYVSVGELHFINWSGEIKGNSALLRIERLGSLAKLMLKGLPGFLTIAQDHSIDDMSGYYKGVP
jgi:hypothetical protein